MQIIPLKNTASEVATERLVFTALWTKAFFFQFEFEEHQSVGTVDNFQIYSTKKFLV